jgi:DNA-binding NarL/FixJ family response regulator
MISLPDFPAMKDSKPARQTTQKRRVLVADDHPLLREGLMPLINRQKDLECCGETDCAPATQKAIETLKPDLLLLDLRLGEGDGIEFIKMLHSLHPTLPILVLSQFDENTYAERVLRAGARGYVMKQEATEAVLTAIRAVLDGELYVSRRIAVSVLNKFLQSKPTAGSGLVERLSDRELQVFQMVGSGMRTRDISTKLGLSIKTIETHRENIKHKLGLQAGPDLVRHATRWVEGNP